MHTAQSLNTRGNEERSAGRLEAAAKRYREALGLDGDFAPALYNLAVCLRDLGRPAEAAPLLRRLRSLDAGDADAAFHLGELLYAGGAFADAIPVLRDAARLAPDNPVVCLYLGVCLARQYQAAEAEGWLLRAAQLAPELPDVHLALGNVYSLMRADARALSSFRRAVEADPGNPVMLSALLYESQRQCEWSSFDALVARLREALRAQPGAPVLPFPLLSLPTTPLEQRDYARQYSRRILEAAEPALAAPPFAAAGPATRKLKIGYLSSDLHEHATAYLAAELFELHDRRRFEVVAYSYGPEDASPMRDRLRRAFDRFVEVGALSSADAARSIRADGIDILVDLKGYTLFARPEILACRPAPLQLSYLGYPGTMGAPFVDYLVGDSFVTPAGSEDNFDEKLMVLPGCYQVNDRQRRIGPPPSRAAAGLPAEGFVFCCFNQSYKILPATFDLWLSILGAVPGSVLWLLEGNAPAAENLRQRARRAGIDPARLVFALPLPLEAHLGRLGLADLFLDTWPYNAHTTASDALWVGLPVLTCAGDSFASRVAGSLLRACGLEELVLRSGEDYRAAALRLARDRRELARIRAVLDGVRRDCTGPFDTPRFVRALEAGYEQAWQLHRAGLPPAHIEVRE